MAVFTNVTPQDAQQFLKGYNLGKLTSIHGIAEGVENSNFLLQADGINYILTLFERRTDVNALPYFMDLMTHVHQQGIHCPLPIAANDGNVLQTLNDRTAVISSFLQGTSVTDITIDHCQQLGNFLANFHQKTASFKPRRQNHLGYEQWKNLLLQCLDKVSNREQTFIHKELGFASECSLSILPAGTIHADLYPDNLFFKDNKISGIIDFYFSCYEALLWDVAICINGWCFDKTIFLPDQASALLNSYNSARAFTLLELEHLTTVCRMAALRIYATRLHDWHFNADSSTVGKKDPQEPVAQILFYRDNILTL